jgi:hypothetical protein
MATASPVAIFKPGLASVAILKPHKGTHTVGQGRQLGQLPSTRQCALNPHVSQSAWGFNLHGIGPTLRLHGTSVSQNACPFGRNLGSPQRSQRPGTTWHSLVPASGSSIALVCGISPLFGPPQLVNNATNFCGRTMCCQRRAQFCTRTRARGGRGSLSPVARRAHSGRCQRVC